MEDPDCGLTRVDIEDFVKSWCGDEPIKDAPVNREVKKVILELRRLKYRRLIWYEDEQDEFLSQIENLRIRLGDR